MSDRVTLVALSLMLAACGPSAEPKGALTMTVSPSLVDADGVSFALIRVEGTSIGQVVVRSSLGRFEEIGPIVFFDKAPFSTMLVTCDSRTDVSCAGMARVSVVDQSLASAEGQVNFRQLP